MTNPTPPSASASFVGWALIVMGGLMALLCGGCTLVMIGVAAFSSGTSPPAAIVGSAMVVLLFGGLPTLAGAVLVWAGWRIVRPLKPPPAKVGDTFK